jgi:hypothetical protein
LRGDADVAILVDRQGGLRMVDPTGWSLPSLRVEFGAGSVYKVERYAGVLRVEGWDGNQRCLIQRPLARPAMPAFRPGPPRLLALGAPA